MSVEIKSHYGGRVLYTAENAQDVRQAVVEAVDSGANLRDAYLRGANLRGAYLRGAYLSDANLSGANLRDANLRGAYLSGANLHGANLHGANLHGANLRDANLRGAYLSDANLRGANLHGANLSGANLHGANLHGANLRDANLRGAYLSDANLSGANLRDANLRGAYLSDANLSGANLSGANLRGANLRGANLHPEDAANWRHPLWSTRQDYFSILDLAPAEVVGLRQAIVDGRIDGSTYTGSCSCLAGTIATVHGCDVEDLGNELGIQPNASRPAEQWFIVIKEGDKPSPVDTKDWSSESVFRLSWALIWLDEWVESRSAVAKVLAS